MITLGRILGLICLGSFLIGCSMIVCWVVTGHDMFTGTLTNLDQWGIFLIWCLLLKLWNDSNVGE